MISPENLDRLENVVLRPVILEESSSKDLMTLPGGSGLIKNINDGATSPSKT